MSRPRSRSPHYKRFPWEEPSFDPHKVGAKLAGSPERDWIYSREDLPPDGHRRSSFPEGREHGRQRRGSDEFYHRKPSPRGDPVGFNGRKLSPPSRGGVTGRGGDGRREAFQKHFQGLGGTRGRSPLSLPSLVRDRLPQTGRLGWRHEEEEGGGQGRFRDLSPSARAEEHRGGAGRDRGRRMGHGPDRDRRREEPHQERSPPFKRQRREESLGYRIEEDFGGQRSSVHTSRDRFGGTGQGSVPLGDARPLGPLVIEHDHGISQRRKTPQWESTHQDFNRQRSPLPLIPPQERFRKSDALSRDTWRDSARPESRRSPVSQDRPNAVRYPQREGSASMRGRGGPRPASGRPHREQEVKTGPLRNPTHLQQQQCTLGYQDPPHRVEHRPGPRAFREDSHKDLMEGNAQWGGVKAWDHERPPRGDPDPKMPRQRLRGWNDLTTTTTTTTTNNNNNNSSSSTPSVEETLTIKVDMTRPVKQSSQLCYSSDRQLSLDLVNVGRQRLDFLPMLEHSGTYQETSVHTGTFAQEIIALVHQVKEQYFRDDGVTLNQRFSAPQPGGFSEEETTELTLDQRFTSNRGFSLDMDSLLDDVDPLDSMQSEQPVRGPGDLRHDLERRRQERLEGVKVTIRGGFLSQRPRGAIGDETSPDQLEDHRFSTWSEEPSRSHEGHVLQRRGASFRQNLQRRNQRFTAGQQFHRSNPAGPNW